MNKKLSIVFLLTLSAIFLLFAVTAFAEKMDVDLQALSNETQKFSKKTEEMTMVWWIPEEFWVVSLSQSPDMTPERIEEFLNIIRPYTMIVAVDGNMGPFGGVTYKSEEVVRSGIKLFDSKNRSYSPKQAVEIGADTKSMLMIMKPIFANMLGPMGENMHFILFPGKTKEGTPIADAKGKGQFSIKLGTNEFKWRLPLDSLVPVQICRSCKQECKGSWSYCAWCGNKLGK